MSALDDDRQPASPGAHRADAVFHATLLDTAVDALLLSDDQGRVSYVSGGMSRLLGYPPSALLGTAPLELFHPDEVERVVAAFAVQLGMPGTERTVECRARHRDRAWVWTDTTVTNLLHHPEVTGMALSLHDIHDRVELERQLVHRALHDPLTGLPNRGLLVDRLGLALDRMSRTAGLVAVLLVDLDDFKAVNDAHGHAGGDAVLVTLARRLVKRMRADDTVARLGGDEFVVVCDVVAGRDEIERLRARVVSAFRDPVWIDRHPVRVSASVGVAVTDHRDTAVTELVAAADTDMYAHKRRRRPG